MKDQQVQRHANSLPDNSLTASGGVPVPFNKEAGAFSGSWGWGIVVDPLGPGETAECRLMLGVDDNGSLTVDGEGIFIPGEGKYHGGSYREKSLSFPIEPGPHRVHMTYENVAVPPEWTNLAILNYSIEVMVSDGTSSSSYQPDEGYPEPVSTEDEGKTCRANAGRRLLAAMAPRAVPVLPVRRKTTEKGITVKMRIPAPVKTMRAAAAALRRAARALPPPFTVRRPPAGAWSPGRSRRK